MFALIQEESVRAPTHGPFDQGPVRSIVAHHREGDGQTEAPFAFGSRLFHREQVPRLWYYIDVSPRRHEGSKNSY